MVIFLNGSVTAVIMLLIDNMSHIPNGIFLNGSVTAVIKLLIDNMSHTKWLSFSMVRLLLLLRC